MTVVLLPMTGQAWLSYRLMTTLAGIYARISDDRESLAHGVGSQIEDGHALCARDGLTVYDVYTDNDLSASTKARKARPEYQRLLADARAGRIQVIVSLSSSRLTRTPIEHEAQIRLATEHGVRYLFGKSPSFDLNSADGRQVARMLAATDAAEAERTSERVRRDVLRRVQAGEHHGGPRGYGIAKGGRDLVPDEADQIREWAKHVLAGGTLAGLAAGLNKKGVPSPGGGEWRPWVIRRVLLAPRIAGLRIHDGAEYKAANPEIIKPDVWRAVCRVLTDPARKVHDHGPARRHLGTALFLCDACDRTVRANYHRTGRRIYRCDGCYRTWDAQKLDAFVIELSEAALVDEDRRARLLPQVSGSGHLDDLRAEAKAITENIAAMGVDAGKARTAAGRAGIMAGIAEADERLVEVERQLSDGGQSDALAAVLNAKDPVAAYRALDDLGRRQAVVRGLFELRLGPPIRGRRAWTPEFLDASRWTGDDLTWGQRRATIAR